MSKEAQRGQITAQGSTASLQKAEAKFPGAQSEAPERSGAQPPEAQRVRSHLQGCGDGGCASHHSSGPITEEPRSSGSFLPS